eukprot:4281377-Alexandrium_andersonii.AAC.1
MEETKKETEGKVDPINNWGNAVTLDTIQGMNETLRAVTNPEELKAKVKAIQDARKTFVDMAKGCISAVTALDGALKKRKKQEETAKKGKKPKVAEKEAELRAEAKAAAEGPPVFKLEFDDRHCVKACDIQDLTSADEKASLASFLGQHEPLLVQATKLSTAMCADKDLAAEMATFKTDFLTK